MGEGVPLDEVRRILPANYFFGFEGINCQPSIIIFRGSRAIGFPFFVPGEKGFNEMNLEKGG